MSRTMQHTTRCPECNRIQVNNTWVAERREYFVRYLAGFCPRCSPASGSVRVPLSPGTVRPSAPARSMAAGG